MSTAVGLRDQRLALYARGDTGTDGYARSTFALSVTRWGRLDESAAGVRAMQSRLQVQIDAVAEFSDETVIPLAGIIRNTGDGRAWWVRGFIGVRMLRRVMVGLERIADEQFRTFEIFDGPSSLDGTHLVEPAAALPVTTAIKYTEGGVPKLTEAGLEKATEAWET